MKRTAVLLTALFVGLASAGLLRSAKELWVNGRKSVVAPIDNVGNIYVPVSALKDAGAEVNITADRVSIQFTPVGGRNQVDAAEGVVGDWVSNDKWRVRVTEVQPSTNPFTGKGPGYKLVFEMRNLGTKAQSAHGSGLDQVQLIDTDGKVLTPSAGSFKDRYAGIPPGGGIKNTLAFGDPQGGTAKLGEADKVLVLFKSQGAAKLRNIRIHLRS